MPKITTLGEVTTSLKDLYSHLLNTPVKVHQYSGPIVREELNPEECYLQITFVSPAFTEEEERERDTLIKRTTNLRKFKFSTPFTKGSKAQGTVAEQWKRNNVCHVTHAFPYLKTRQQVVKREEVILSPVEAAVSCSTLMCWVHIVVVRLFLISIDVHITDLYQLIALLVLALLEEVLRDHAIVKRNGWHTSRLVL